MTRSEKVNKAYREYRHERLLNYERLMRSERGIVDYQIWYKFLKKADKEYSGIFHSAVSDR